MPIKLDPAHVVDQLPTDRTGERRLAVAVISQGFKDLRRGTVAARLWFTSQHSGLSFWCEALDLDPDAVRKYAIERAEHKPPRRRRR